MNSVDGARIGMRTAAIVLALLNIFGLLFFADYYLAPEHRLNLLIYGWPIISLSVAAVTPGRWFRFKPLAILFILIALVGIAALTIAIHRDITLINGADWTAAILRLITIALLLALIHPAFAWSSRHGVNP